MKCWWLGVVLCNLMGLLSAASALIPRSVWTGLLNTSRINSLDLPPECGMYNLGIIEVTPSAPIFSRYFSPAHKILNGTNIALSIPDYSPQPPSKEKIFFAVWSSRFKEENYRLLISETKPKPCAPKCSFQASVRFTKPGVYDLLFGFLQPHKNCLDTTIETFYVTNDPSDI